MTLLNPKDYILADDYNLDDTILREVFGDSFIDGIDFKKEATFLERREKEMMAELTKQEPLEFLPWDQCDRMEAKLNINSRWTRGGKDARAVDLFIMDWFDGKSSFARMILNQSPDPFYLMWSKEHGKKPGQKLFREFKDYKGWTRAQVYADYCKIFEAPGPNGKRSALDIFMEHAPYVLRDNLSYYVSKQDLMRIISLRLWYATLGVIKEDVVATRLENMAKTKEWNYVRDDGKLENADVDGMLVYPDREVKVSIKNLDALSIPFLWNDYRRKGKTMPDVYVGFRTRENSELTWIKAEEVEAWGMKNDSEYTKYRKQIDLWEDEGDE